MPFYVSVELGSFCARSVIHHGFSEAVAHIFDAFDGVNFLVSRSVDLGKTHLELFFISHVTPHVSKFLRFSDRLQVQLCENRRR